MAQSTALPSESEREAFANKLLEFRNSLTPAEQRMLDAMAIAAFGPKEPEVEGYKWFYHTERSHRPGWYYYYPKSWNWTNSLFAWHWPFVP